MPAAKRSTRSGHSRNRRYGDAASRSVASAMRRRKRSTLRNGSGARVRSARQAIAIGLSEARKKGARVPRPRG